MEQTNNLTNWIDEELSQQTTTTTYNKKPSLKLKKDAVTKIVIDFSTKFTEWKDAEQETVKAIIPVKAKDETGTVVDMVWWLNKKNPVYNQILKAYKETQKTDFSIFSSGSQSNTKYTIISN